MYLGIDLGTSEIKLVLLDDGQSIVATVSEPLTLSRPKAMWSEQQPEDWWVAFERAADRLQRSHAPMLAATKGIGLSGQMHGAVLLDEHDCVLRPAILWNDVRSGAQCVELERVAPLSRQITGNLAMPGFTAPKLLWVAQHEIEIFRLTKKVLLPKDYLRLRLSGEYVSDMSDAAGTLWLDVEKRDWSDTMLSATQLRRDQMPRLVEGNEPSAMLRSDLARRWGMAKNVIIAGGAGDNTASAIGMGAISEGQAFISLGTSGVFFVATDGYRPNPEQGVHTFCHALPARWHQMAVILSAASCLRWVTQLTHASSEAALLAEIETLRPEVLFKAPLFLPYLSGERTPHNDPNAMGVWFGLSHDTDRTMLAYAVLEGVAFALLDGYRALQQTGSIVETVSLVGGGSKSRYWVQLLANVLGLRCVRHSGGEVGAAVGAARLGLMAANKDEIVNRICTAPAILDVIEPQVKGDERLIKRYEKFRSLYGALRERFPD